MQLTDSKHIVSEDYRQPITFALAIQIPICIVSLLTLDHGVLSKICGCAMLGFWLGVSLILTRRPFTPQPSDVSYIRYGFVAIFLAAILLGEMRFALFG